MANKKKQEPNPNAYKGKEYLTMEESSDYLGLKRSALYSSMIALNIKSHKFELNSKHFLAMSDVERIKEAREKPWLIKPNK